MKRTIKLISFVLALLCASCCFASCEIAPDAYYIFEDISECEKFAESGHTNIEITERGTSEVRYIDGLEFTSYYGAYYKSNELDFTIDAFEFIDDTTAKEYYRRVEGVQISGIAAASSRHDFPHYFVVAIDGKRAYVISSTSSHSKIMNEFLSQMFSKKLTA